MSKRSGKHNRSAARWLKQAAIWVGSRLDPLAALLCGIAAALSGVFGVIEGDGLTIATLGVLSVVAFSLVHERTLRLRASKSIDEVLAQLNRARDSIRALETAKPYQVLLHRSTWDITQAGDFVSAIREKRIRFAQNEVVSLNDWSTGDGHIEDIKYTPGKAVHTYKEADGRDYTLIALDRMYARDEELFFRTERQIRHAFPGKSERVTVVALDSTSVLQMTVRWPQDRPPTAVRVRKMHPGDNASKITEVPISALTPEDDRQSYTVEVQEPDLGCRTSIEWDW